MNDLVIEGRITNITLLNFQQTLATLLHHKYTLHTTGLGGEIDSAIDISKLISKRGKQIIGFAHGEVASSTLLIHQSCKGGRFATPTTKFLLHGLDPLPGFQKEEKHRKSEYFIFDFYAKITGRTLDEIYQLAQRNIYISAKDALEFGFVTDIIDRPFPTYS